MCATQTRCCSMGQLLWTEPSPESCTPSAVYSLYIQKCVFLPIKMHILLSISSLTIHQKTC